MTAASTVLSVDGALVGGCPGDGREPLAPRLATVLGRIAPQLAAQVDEAPVVLDRCKVTAQRAALVAAPQTTFL